MKLKKLSSKHGPRYEHDCDECIFIGHRGKTDIYLCLNPSPHEHTIIFRHSDEGSDYASTKLRRDQESLISLLEVVDHNAQVN